MSDETKALSLVGTAWMSRNDQRVRVILGMARPSGFVMAIPDRIEMAETVGSLAALETDWERVEWKSPGWFTREDTERGYRDLGQRVVDAEARLQRAKRLQIDLFVEMEALLREVQWKGTVRDGGSPCCVTCNATVYVAGDGSEYPPPHDRDCPIGNLLARIDAKKAGE